MLGISIIGELAVGEIRQEDDISTPNLFTAFLRDNNAERNYVLEVNPPALIGAASLSPYTIGEYAIGEWAPEDYYIRGAQYWSTLGLKTSATDEPPGKNFPPYLKNAFNYSAGIPPPASGIGSGSSALGYITVANVGDLDEIIAASSWEGRTIKMYLGGTLHVGRSTETILPFLEYTKIYTLQIDNIKADESEIEIAIRDPALLLDVPIQQSTYSGSGDYEGGDDVKGKHKPVALGNFFKAPAVLVNATHFIFQYHDGAGTTVSEVLDKGDKLTFEGDATDLLSTTVSIGKYKTDVSRGLVRINADPAGTILVDGVGVGGTTISSICKYLTELAGVVADDASFNTYGQYQAGYWAGTWDEDITGVLTDLMSCIDGWYIFRRNGTLAIGEHPDLDNTTPVLTIEGRSEALTDSPVSVIDGSLVRFQGPVSVWKYSLKYKKYWWVDSSVKETLSAQEKSDLAQSYRAIDPVNNISTKSTFQDALEIERETFLTDEAEVTALANAWLLRDGKHRAMYEFSIGRDLFKLVPGDIIKLFHDRFNLSSGKIGEVLSLDEDAETYTSTITVLIYE